MQVCVELDHLNRANCDELVRMEPTIDLVDLVAMLGPVPDRDRADWLARRLGTLIVDGRLPLGARLPSERALADRLGLSRGTIVRGLEFVQHRGLLSSRQGSGRAPRLPAGSPRPVESLAARTTPVPDGTIDLRATVLPPHPELQRVAVDVAGEIGGDPAWGSVPADGLPELVDAVCRHYAQRGLPTEPGQVIITNGAVSGLHLALQAVSSPGDRIGIENPNYQNTVRVVRAARRRPVPLDVGADVPAPARQHGAALTRAIDGGRLAAAFITADFHNPTGALLDADTRSRLFRAAARRDTAVVVDETLREQNWRGRSLPAPDLDDRGTIIRVGSVSKTLWAGLRIGWIRTEPALADALSRIRLGVDLGAPIMEQRITAQLLPGLPTNGIPEVSQRLRAQYETVAAGLTAKLPHWRWAEPDGGLSVWCTGLRRGADDLVAAAAGRGVALTASALFSPTGRGWSHAVRIPFSAPAWQLERAITVLAELDG